MASRPAIKERDIFKDFKGWQDGYAAFKYSIDAKDNLIEYVKDQEEHHKNKTFREELVDLLREHGVISMRNIWIRRFKPHPGLF